MQEIWKKVEGHERYEVSNMGRVKSFVRKKEGWILAPRRSNGYERVWIDGKNYSIHRLVAKAFCEGYAEGLVTNHINEIKHDNRVENLEWVTVWQNVHHGTGLARARMALMKPIIMLNKKGAIINRFSGAEEAANKLGICRDTVYKYTNGKRKCPRGYMLVKEEDMQSKGLIQMTKHMETHNIEEKQAA